ncbi:pitrilysin family protein [Candidatus Halobeggiatoa sp. HSG11]|nr:pitrilysin family protein [Candidatus Halobeggiatoa sp. HSG11]
MKIVILTIGLLMAQFVLAIPTIQHWQTANGTKVYFVPAPDLPMVNIEVVFDAGSARDGSKPGLAKLTNGLFNEGAGGYSADQIAEKFDNLGAEFSNSVSRDMAKVKLRSLTEPKLLQPALEMLALLLTKPDFESKSLERVRQQMLTSLKYKQQSPDDIVDKEFYEAVFGKHPYATLPAGTIESVTALTREDLQQFHKQYYIANNALISIVGALDRKAAENLANTIAKLPSGEVPTTIPPVTLLTEAKTVHVKYPATQTKILIGQPGLKRGDKDYFSLYLGNYILGGAGLVSRLSEEVREKRGLAYSAYSYFMPQRVLGAFIAGLGTRNDQAAQAIELVQKTMRDFIKNGPTETELKEAKQGITGRFPLRIKSNRDIVGYLSMLGFYNLSLDYLHTFNANIEAVTLPMIQDAFQRRIDVNKLVTVTVGGE